MLYWQLTKLGVHGETPEAERAKRNGMLFAAGMIPGTDLNIDFREMKARHRELGAKLEDHIVVYCQSGHRSNIAAETLADLGYTHVYNVVGSMNAWTEAGFPVSPGR